LSQIWNWHKADLSLHADGSRFGVVA